jgi:L-ascorbate metabolism protein UlaG (beta-lactamase superfamily)
VFASHGHPDHFSPEVFEWRQHSSRIHYILSYDIQMPSFDVTQLKPGDATSVGGIRVRAYASTDHGLAYSIYAQGRHIYFAGDNAFWNWDGDLDDDIYHRIALDAIDTQIPMDIAFQVCDPRLEGMGDGGIHIFARAFQPKLLVPIHSFGNYAFNVRVEKRLRTDGFAHRFWCVSRPGDVLVLNN